MKNMSIKKFLVDLKETFKKLGTSKKRIYSWLQYVFTIVFFVSAFLFVNEVFIQPYRSRKVMDEIKNIYQNTGENPASDTPLTDVLDSGSSDLNGCNPATLPKFNEILKINDDVQGWITIPLTKIDYPVLKAKDNDPDFYLSRNIYGEKDKNGSIFIDANSSIEAKNIVIHGHNMKSGDMFHDLVEFQDIEYYKLRPVIYFDTIYQTNAWKIISVFITNGSSAEEPFFDYTRSEFVDSSDFLNFVYQLKVRSIYNTNVDINENDQLITLSTCTYELPDYRNVVVARKVRDNEEIDVDVEKTTKNNPLYPEKYYKTYGGTPPEVSSFEEALNAGEIDWYNPDYNPISHPASAY